MTLTDYLIECSRNTDITVTDLSEVLVERFFFGKFDSVIEGQRKIYDAILDLKGDDS